MTGSAVHGNVTAVAGVGVYPGSFNPPTRAHVEIALTALTHHRLDRLDLMLSTSALGKEFTGVPSFAHRLTVVRDTVAGVDGLEACTTDAQLIVDIAAGYDVVVMGADKWTQVNDPSWYHGAADRDAALARLPTVALAPRPPHTMPADLALPLPPDLIEISSSGVRAGRVEWMTPAAAAFDQRTGAWTDPARYRTIFGELP